MKKLTTSFPTGEVRTDGKKLAMLDKLLLRVKRPPRSEEPAVKDEEEEDSDISGATDLLSSIELQS